MGEPYFLLIPVKASAKAIKHTPEQCQRNYRKKLARAAHFALLLQNSGKIVLFTLKDDKEYPDVLPYANTICASFLLHDRLWAQALDLFVQARDSYSSYIVLLYSP